MPIQAKPTDSESPTFPNHEISRGQSRAERPALNSSNETRPVGDSLHSSKPRQSNVLNRIRDVRIEQGVSLRSVSLRLGTPIPELRQQEEPTADLTISQLLCWQQVLDVPLSDLLVENDEVLSAPLHQRGQLIRIMKTAGSIESVNKNSRVKHLCTMLREQLITLMPELQEITTWPNQGSRRSADEAGQRLENPISFGTNR